MSPWTAFLLGLVGSIHCAGMCGPLALALPAGDRSLMPLLTGRLLYHYGRIITYTFLGILFGLLGQSFLLMGIQRWLSLAIGAAILAGLIFSPGWLFGAKAYRVVNWIKGPFVTLLRQRGWGALFGIGLLNGLLPCGLVYTACAIAMTLDSLAHSIEYMIAFGFGTLPLMLVISLLGQRLQFILRFKLQRLIPISLAVVGTLLVLRGLALGIPHLSPKLSVQTDAVRQCCQGH